LQATALIASASPTDRERITGVQLTPPPSVTRSAHANGRVIRLTTRRAREKCPDHARVPRDRLQAAATCASRVAGHAFNSDNRRRGAIRITAEPDKLAEYGNKWCRAQEVGGRRRLDCVGKPESRCRSIARSGRLGVQVSDIRADSPVVVGGLKISTTREREDYDVRGAPIVNFRGDARACHCDRAVGALWLGVAVGGVWKPAPVRRHHA